MFHNTFFVKRLDKQKFKVILRIVLFRTWCRTCFLGFGLVLPTEARVRGHSCFSRNPGWISDRGKSLAWFSVTNQDYCCVDKSRTSLQDTTSTDCVPVFWDYTVSLVRRRHLTVKVMINERLMCISLTCDDSIWKLAVPTDDISKGVPLKSSGALFRITARTQFWNMPVFVLLNFSKR